MSMSNDNEEALDVIQFDKKGVLGDFVRKARSTWRTLPTNNVHCLMVRCGRSVEGDEEEKIPLNAANLWRPIEGFNFTPKFAVPLDIYGLVNAKKNVSKK